MTHNNETLIPGKINYVIHCTILGLIIGMALGIGALGMVFGAAIGTALDKRTQGKEV